MRSLPLYTDPRIAVLRDQPRSVQPQCTRCALHTNARNVCIRAIGAPGGLLVIGDYPTSAEDREGVPFISESGSYLKKLINLHWTGPVAMDYALRCPKGVKKLPTNAIDKCRGYLLQTILEVKPTRVLCMGSTALASLFGESIDTLSLKRAVAWLTDIDGNAPVPVFLMPSAGVALRNRFQRWQLEDEVKWALTVDPASLPSIPVDGVVQVVETLEDAQKAEAHCKEAGGVSYDVENVGRVGNHFLRLVSVSCTPYETDEAYVWSREALAASDTRNVLAGMLANQWLPKSGSFLKHDHEVSSQVLNIRIRGTDADIRLQRKVLDAHSSGRLEQMGYLIGMGGHKLEMEDAISDQCAAIHAARKKKEKAVGFLPGMFDDIFEEAVNSPLDAKVFAYGMVNHDLLYRYNALDTIVTERCRRRFKAEIATIAPVQHIWDSVVQNTVEAITQVESWGVHVSRGAIEAFGSYTDHKMREIAKHFTPYHVEPSSPTQMAEFLYNTLKLSNPKEGSTDEEALEMISDEHPIVEKLLEFRTFEKLNGTYAKGLLKHIRDDGRIHPSIDVAGASTGRTSSKDPNLQNQPRARDDDYAMARRVFTVPEGRLLVVLDYSQLEYRVAAMLSGDEKMKQMFRDGIDVHLGTAQLIAREFFKVDPSAITAEMRDTTKTFNFGVLYGMQDFTLAKRMKISEERAKQIRKKIMGEFTTLQEYIDACIAEAEKTGYTWTWWDGQRARRRWLYQIANPRTDNKKERASIRRARNGALNTRVQGTASDYCVRSLVDAVNWILDDAVDAMLVLPIHDALVFDSAEDYVDEVAKMARDIMLSHNSLDVPMGVDIKVGKTMGDLKKYKVAA